MFQRILSGILALSLTFSGVAHATALSCQDLFDADNVSTANGSALGPLEYIRNIKQKMIGSRALRRFDQTRYEEALRNIKENELRVENGFRPQTLEEAIAYLDIQLETLSISFQTMPPILRHKVIKTVESVLKSEGKDVISAGDDIAEFIFRGNHQSPTSFANLLRLSPNKTGQELFVQHLQTLTVVQIVKTAYEYDAGPQRPGFVARLSPKFIRANKDAINAGFWAGISVLSSVHGISTDSIFLAPLNVFKLKENQIVIENSLATVGLEKTIENLSPEFKNKKLANYAYAVTMKAVNWYFLSSLLFGLFTDEDDIKPPTN